MYVVIYPDTIRSSIMASSGWPLWEHETAGNDTRRQGDLSLELLSQWLHLGEGGGGGGGYRVSQ